MAIDERRRAALYDGLAASIGDEAATTLFELLPGAGDEAFSRRDADVRFATLDERFDAIDRRFDEVDRRFEAVDRRFDEVDQRFEALELRMDTRFAEWGERFERRISDAVTTQTRTLVLSQLGALVVIAALAFGLR